MPLIMGYELLLEAVACVVPFFSTVKVCCGVSISWGRYISSGWWSSSLSPVSISSSPPIIGGMTPAEVHGYWDIVHGWRCIGGVVILWAAPLLVVALPVVLEEGSSGLVVEVLEWGSSCKALFQDVLNHCSSLCK